MAENTPHRDDEELDLDNTDAEEVLLCRRSCWELLPCRADDDRRVSNPPKAETLPKKHENFPSLRLLLGVAPRETLSCPRMHCPPHHLSDSWPQNKKL